MRPLALATTVAAAAVAVCGIAVAANAAGIDACVHENCVSVRTPDETPVTPPPPLPRGCAYIHGVWTCW